MGRALLLVCGVVYAVAFAAPAWRDLHRRAGAKDHATFHLAVREAAAGGDPWDTAALRRRGRQEGLSTEIHPWIYPPPALLAFAWTLPLPLRLSQQVGFFLQQGALVGLLVLLRRWLTAPVWLLGAALLAFGPVLAQSARVGQINPALILLMAWAFSRRSGAGVAAAALVKMSPAALLLPWALQGRLRPLAAAALATLGLSAAALLLVDLPTQAAFWTTTLPALAAGSWNGMSVPLDLPANHSVPNLLHKLLGGDSFALSPRVRALSAALSLAALVPLAWVARRRRDPLGEGLLFGALTAWMVVTPAYAWEHHLVLLLPAGVAAAQAAWVGRLAPWALPLALALTLWPLGWFREARAAWPHLAPLIEESKLLGVLLLGGLCLWGAHHSPRASPPPSD